MSSDISIESERESTEKAIQGFILDPRVKNYWDRQDDEPLESFEWFLVYRDLMPEERGIRMARMKVKETMPDLDTEKHYAYSRKYKWKERALEWDRFQDKIQQAKWVKRRLVIREKEWDLSSELIKKAEAMLKFPLSRARQESQDGKLVTIIEPADWRFADIHRVIGMASRLARLSANMETGKLSINVEDLDRTIERELAQLTAGDEAGVSEEDTGGEGGEESIKDDYES
jgi:hypothetical protein